MSNEATRPNGGSNKSKPREIAVTAADPEELARIWKENYGDVVINVTLFDFATKDREDPYARTDTTTFETGKSGGIIFRNNIPDIISGLALPLRKEKSKGTKAKGEEAKSKKDDQDKQQATRDE